MALCRVRNLQVVRRARARRPTGSPREPRTLRHPWALRHPRALGDPRGRVAPPDAAGARRTQGVLALALHTVC